MKQPGLEKTVKLQAVAEHAPPRSSKLGVLDQAYEEFCLRRAQGEDLDPDEFCKDYPSLLSSLNRLIHVHLFLEDNAFLVDDAEPDHWPQAGETFLDSRLIEELGQGSFARVFLAEELKLGNRRVAVKIAPRGGAEADILGRFNHPNVVPVLSVREDEATGLTAVCMPFLGRATLTDVLDCLKARPKLPTASILREAIQEAAGPDDPLPALNLARHSHVDSIRHLAIQLADALAYIHGLGVCHRDLKPSNVLLSPAGVPMLLDFNLSTDASSPPGLGGTIPYMAPEQLRSMIRQGDAKAASPDGRSDIFALGVILHELLTGRHPFEPLSRKLPSREFCIQLLQRHEQGAVNACIVNPEVDGAFGRLIQRCLAFDPNDRPASAAELARELRKGLAPLTKTRRWIARHSRAVLAGSVLLLAVGASGAYYVAQLPPLSERQAATGASHFKEGRYDEAVQHYTAAIKADPANAASYFARGRVYLKMGQEDKLTLAMDDFRIAQRLAPDGRNLACMAYCEHLKQNHEGAKGFYIAAIEAGFQSAEVHSNLGYLYLAKNDLESARNHLDQAVSMDPGFQLAFHNRALMFDDKAQSIANRLMAPKKNLEAEAKNHGLSLKDYLDRTRAELLSLANLGISDVQTALRLEPDSADLEHDAASLYALAGRADPQKLSQVIPHLQSALDKGLDPRRLKGDWAFEPVAKDARFVALLARPSPANPARLIHFVDPVKDR